MSDLLDTTSWAVTECADADLGALRRTRRVVQLAHALAQRPGAALPEACGSGAMRKAASRFFANEDMAPDDMLQSHIEATSSRLNTVPLVWAVVVNRHGIVCAVVFSGPTRPMAAEPTERCCQSVHG